jgi:hypothetical protein
MAAVAVGTVGRRFQDSVSDAGENQGGGENMMSRAREDVNA